MNAGRLRPRPGERIDRGRPLTFRFDGREIPAFEGDTITSALAAQGRLTISRSFKYHRRRGDITAAGNDGGGLVTVEGRPSVRAALEPVRQGLDVRSQNAWPSLERDAMRIVDLIGGPFTPPGFYYKTFRRPRRLWPLYERILRRASGLGRVPDPRDERVWRTEHRYVRCDVLVIGGGEAGLHAAIRAASGGAEVLLVDDDVEPGGHLLVDGRRDEARRLADEAREAGVELLAGAAALGFFDGLVPVAQGATLQMVRAEQYVTATGGIEQPLVFPGNDLPGIMTASGARRLVELQAVALGSRAVVATIGDPGLEAALTLHDAGVRVAAISDLRTAGDPDLVARVADAGITYLPGTTVVRARGRRTVREVVVSAIGPDGRASGGTRHVLDCDLLAMAGSIMPASSLLLQSGATGVFDVTSGRFLPGDLPAGVHAAGVVAGHDGASRLSGAAAGDAALAALGLAVDEQRRDEQSRRLAAHEPRPVAVPPAVAHDGRRRGRAFVDLDEDVTAKDVAYAAAEGFDGIQLSKRYTTATMGPSQGRVSHLGSIRALAAATGRDVAEIGMTTARPPWTPVELGVLAGRPHAPARRSTIDGRHRAAGGIETWVGDWRRPESYGDIAAEVLAVRERIGAIDVSTLGKLLVRGPDADALLDAHYTRRMSDAPIGRLRYGLMTDDRGRIVDDGTVCRTGDGEYYVTTTSGGVAGVLRRLTWWREDLGLDVRITDLTASLGAITVAGPASRELLGELAEIDLDREAFPHLTARRGSVAGVPCLAMRVGFVGELAYELHLPSEHAVRVWDAVVAAGARPVGIEAQRTLRLEKLHPIVGQDTDAESTPASAGLGWAVKLDDDRPFVGSAALRHLADQPLRERLVGFRCPGDGPREGAAVVAGGRAVGRVTSARSSPQLGECVGLAWVAPDAIEDGTPFEIRDGGRTLTAFVARKAPYDPDGARAAA
ncbi:2Fe-2S iron-sulfur cluster-binding protein [Patulibacter defluvii]|uniref:2Fe-2S iron-sulfur cluster-binding protein n=1 Tax=Patulibacter defluvii TaxID=3095358 RepID=UPI002A75F894|nr:2Fe-2S iron-sulfur cluster-binding protein [Patulibacter sp. DM4]